MKLQDIPSYRLFINLYRILIVSHLSIRRFLITLTHCRESLVCLDFTGKDAHFISLKRRFNDVSQHRHDQLDIIGVDLVRLEH